MNVKEYLDKVAYVAECSLDGQEDVPDAYYSKFDNSYMTFVGLEKDLEFLADREITEELTHGVGFSPKDNKWYGWSHRAICGFEVGSTCKKGDCHYVGSSIDEQKEDAIKFWQSESHKNVRCTGIKDRDGFRYFDIKWEYSNDIPNEKLRETIGGCEHFITPLGWGEWVAETMEDAKQMATDFNQGVSQ